MLEGEVEEQLALGVADEEGLKLLVKFGDGKRGDVKLVLHLPQLLPTGVRTAVPWLAGVRWWQWLWLQGPAMLTGSCPQTA